MPELILIRHGDRQKTTNDALAALTDYGRGEIRRLASRLGDRGLRPKVYITSKHAHAVESAEILARVLGGRVIKVSAFTPLCTPEEIEDIVREATRAGADLNRLQVIAFVGHEPRLGQLLTQATSHRDRPFERGEALVLHAQKFIDVLRGQAQLAYRIPATDHQEFNLREKVGSKMTTSALLAGFTFAALTKVLGDAATPPTAAAIVVLTLSLGLFVASIYMYDRLAMPEGFWSSAERAHYAWRPGAKRFQEDRQQNGILYAYMVWTWKFVFTPAVFAGIVGIALMVLNTNDLEVVLGALFAFVGAWLVYHAYRPKLGVD